MHRSPILPFEKTVTHGKTVVVRKVERWSGSMVDDSLKMDSVQHLVFPIPIRFSLLTVTAFTIVKCTMIKPPRPSWLVMYRPYPTVSTKFVSMSTVIWFHCTSTAILLKLISFQCRVRHQPSLALHHHREHHNRCFNWLVHSRHRATHEMSRDVLKITIHWSLGKNR